MALGKRPALQAACPIGCRCTQKCVHAHLPPRCLQMGVQARVRVCVCLRACVFSHGTAVLRTSWALGVGRGRHLHLSQTHSSPPSPTHHSLASAPKSQTPFIHLGTALPTCSGAHVCTMVCWEGPSAAAGSEARGTGGGFEPRAWPRALDVRMRVDVQYVVNTVRPVGVVGAGKSCHASVCMCVCACVKVASCA